MTESCEYKREGSPRRWQDASWENRLRPGGRGPEIGAGDVKNSLALAPDIGYNAAHLRRSQPGQTSNNPAHRGVCILQKNKEDLHLVTVTLDNIVYEFWNGKFSGVIISDIDRIGELSLYSIALLSQQQKIDTWYLRERAKEQIGAWEKTRPSKAK